MLSLPTLFLPFLFFRFNDIFVPEAGNLSEFRVCAPGCDELGLECGLLLNEGPVLRLERLFLLDTLSVQNSQAELQVADLAVITLALLLKTVVLGPNFLQLLDLGGLFGLLLQVLVFLLEFFRGLLLVGRGCLCHN